MKVVEFANLYTSSHAFHIYIILCKENFNFKNSIKVPKKVDTHIKQSFFIINHIKPLIIGFLESLSPKHGIYNYSKNIDNKVTYYLLKYLFFSYKIENVKKLCEKVFVTLHK